MIINIRGGHGSGKSTLVKRVMDLYRVKSERRMPSRKRPLAYECSDGVVDNFVVLRTVAVLGAYETATGGCDTIGSADTIYELVKTYAESGMDVLFEGIVAQHSSGRLMEIHEKHDVRVVVLTTSQETCVESVRSRRAARGASVEEFDPKNVVKEWKSVASSTKSILAKGAKVEQLDREAAFARVCQLLNAAPARPIESMDFSGMGSASEEG